MKRVPRRNAPLDDLSEEEQIDLVIILGTFASSCKKKLSDPDSLSLETILISCLQLYDMNLLYVQKKKDVYKVLTTEIPVSIIQHLVDNDTQHEEAFLSSRAVYLARRFVELTKTEVLPTKSVRKRKN